VAEEAAAAGKELLNKEKLGAPRAQNTRVIVVTADRTPAE
jgi:hypothetical protein